MANSNPCAALENDQISALSGDKRGEAATHEEDAEAELERSSNELNPSEDAAGKLANACVIDRSDARQNNILEENGSPVLAQEEAVVTPALGFSDPSSDVNKGTAFGKGAASDIPRSSMDRSSDALNNTHADSVAQGIASVLGPVMNHFDSGVEGAFKSQSILATSIDRLTRELDKLLEDVPLPFVQQHATRLSGIHKRVLTLNTSLHIIQRRMETIERFLAGYALKAGAKGNQERSSMKNSNLAPHGPFPQRDAPCEAISTSTADADKQEDGGLSIHSKLLSGEHLDDLGA